MKKTVGIDLGTTYTVVSIYDEEQKYPRALKNSYQESITPSVIFFDNKDVIIGKEAKNEFSAGSQESVAFYKRQIGREGYKFNYKKNSYNAEQLSGIFLKSLIKEIEEAENIKISDAVITVPAYFDEEARRETLNAGKFANLNVLAIINEPTAAIIAHGLSSDNINKNVLVFDLGGGTFDVTIAEVNGSEINVLSTGGDFALGGKDFDDAIVKILNDKFELEFGYRPSEIDYEYDTILLHDAEEIKIKLSNIELVSYRMKHDGNEITCSITREEFEFASSVPINRTIQIIDIALAESKLNWSKINEVVLVGGSVRMPLVSKFIEKQIGKPPLFNADVDTVVSFGASIKADLEKKQRSSAGGLTLIKKPSSADTITLKSSDIKDVTSHTLGIISKEEQTEKLVNSHILMKNSKVNEEESRTYRTNSDKLELYLLQGETREPEYSSLLGMYEVTDIRNNMDVNVHIKYDSNGLVDVKATSHNNKHRVIKHQVTESIHELLARLMEETGRKIQKEVNVIVAVDTSGSMRGDPIINASEAVIGLIASVKGLDVKFTIIHFNDIIEELTRDSSDYNRLVNKTNELKRKIRGANRSQPLKHIAQNYQPDENTKIVLLTDGVWSSREKEILEAAKIKANNTEIFAIGFGFADKRFLSEIGSQGLSKHVDLGDLKATFEEIGSTIATEIK